MYANEGETKGKEKLPEIKNSLQHKHVRTKEKHNLMWMQSLQSYHQP